MTRLIALDNNLLNMPLGGGPSEFDFDGVERNLALDAMANKAGLNELVPKVKSTGTTIVASVYKDGVIVGGDSRSTTGHLISNKYSMKLHRLTDSIYAGGAGTAADLDKVTQMIASEMKLFELNNEGKKARVMMAHRRLRQYLFQYQGYVGAYLLVGGVDFKGPHLYEVHASGGGYAKPFSADGSGSYAAIAEMEDNFKPNMTEQECRDMVIKALEAGMHGDNMSGNTYNLVTITASGKRLEGPFIPGFAKRPELEGDYKIAPGTSTVLKLKKMENMGMECFGEIPKEVTKSETPMET